ncbi:MAG: MFS transporter [Candidatus Acidiferrum sp.]
MADEDPRVRRSLRSLEWLNFFLADVQTGLGPFVAAYLAASGWNPGAVGYALTVGGLVTVALQTPAGAVVDAARHKRRLLMINLGVLVCGAILLMRQPTHSTVYSAQILIGGAAPFLAPTVAAMTLGIVGAKSFDRQFGKNQAFNSAGNVFAAVLIAAVSYKFGYRAMFGAAALLAVPAACAVFGIDPRQIDYASARGGAENEKSSLERNGAKAEGWRQLAKDRALLSFLLCVFLFHLANAAMLPQLGELLSKGNPQTAASFMSGCIIVTQLVIAVSAVWIARRAEKHGRKPLLLAGFGVLPIRGILYTLTVSKSALIAIQALDGIANAIFVTVSILVIKDRTQGTGRFNVASGALATMVGIGAALSNTIGGQLIERFGFDLSFLGLAGIAALAFFLLWVWVPETLRIAEPSDSGQEAPAHGVARAETGQH